MRVCTTCDGVITRCSTCGRAHCDDACRPIACQIGESLTKEPSYAKARNQSLKQAYDHYALMAETAPTKAEREQWRMLATQCGNRLGIGVEEPPQLPLF